MLMLRTMIAMTKAKKKNKLKENEYRPEYHGQETKKKTKGKATGMRFHCIAVSTQHQLRRKSKMVMMIMPEAKLSSCR